MLKELETYDWAEAFKYAIPEPVIHGDSCPLDPITREDVVNIKHIQEGENDGASWLLVGEVRDGRWFFLSAWCGYTGWG